MDSFTLMLLAVVGISMYLLIWRPQSKADAEKKARVEKLAKGDRIVTIGGIHGEIHDPQPGKSTVVVQVDKAVRLVFNKSAIHQVNPEPEGKSKEEEKK